MMVVVVVVVVKVMFAGLEWVGDVCSANLPHFLPSCEDGGTALYILSGS
jgi:hypothetical protein